MTRHRSFLRRLPLFSIPGIVVAALALSLLWFGQSGPAPASADHIPQRPNEITFQMNFEATRADMFGPGGLVPSPLQVEVLNFGWSEGLFIDGTTKIGGSFDFFGEKIPLPSAIFGADLTAQVNGSLNVGASMSGFDQPGTIGIKYPVEITLRVPKRDTFRRGDTITIGSGSRLLPGAALTTTPPTRGSVSANATLQAAMDLALDLCIVDCASSFPLTPPPLPLPPIVLPISCAGGGTIELSGPLPAINLFSVGPLGIQTIVSVSEGGTFFQVNDFPDRVDVSPEIVATRLVDAVAKARDENKSLGAVLSEDPVLLYAAMLPGSEADKLVLLEVLLLLTQEVEDCIGVQAPRKDKIGVITTLLNNFTSIACCTGYIGLPQVETRSAAGGTKLVAIGRQKFVDLTVDPVAFFDPPQEYRHASVGETEGQDRQQTTPQEALPPTVGREHL